MSRKLAIPLWLVVAVTLLVVAAQPDAAARKRRGKARARPTPAAAKVAPEATPDAGASAGAAQATPGGGVEAAATSGGSTSAAAAAPAEPAGPVKVAVLDLGMLGLSSAMRKNLEMLLRNSIATIDGFKVIPPVDLQIALQDPKNHEVAQCGGGPECAVAVGRLVGADRVVFGTIGAIGEAFSLDLRVMDVRGGELLAREHSRISGSRDLLIPELRLAAFRMVAPDKISGSLLVDIDVEGVEIEIDGKSVGVTPLARPVEDLAPGSHVVVLKRSGFSEFQQEFTIKPFETARLKLELSKAQ